jgi:regulatory protein
VADAGSAASLRARALRLLARREHSRAELARKLAPFLEDAAEPADPGALERLLNDFTARGLIDEHRTAEALVAAGAGRYGAARLRQNLRWRGVEPEAADDALAAVAGTELERARAVWRRRFGQPAEDAAGRAKQARFLAARGFGSGVIHQVVRGTEPDDGAADG